MLGACVYTPATRRLQQSNTTKSAPSKTRTHPPRARLSSTNGKYGAFDGTSRRGAKAVVSDCFCQLFRVDRRTESNTPPSLSKTELSRFQGRAFSWGRSLTTPLTLSPAGCPWLRLLRSQVKVSEFLVGLVGVSVWQKHHLTFEDHLRKR